MACFYPRTMYPPLGGGRPTFVRPAGHSGRTVVVRCGQCIGCRADVSRDWATRIIDEARFYQSNWFVTLSFDDEHLPDDLCVRRDDVQLFVMRAAKAAKRRGLLEGSGLRCFYNGEYGTETKRPHYHLILFGLGLTDLKKWKRNERGEQMWTSPFLEKVWGKGRVIIGSVSAESAGYVAGYAVRDKWAKSKVYELVDPETGECRERTRPFIGMSRRPGIGRRFVEKFGGQFLAGDFSVVNGRKRPNPPYYHRVLEQLSADAAAVLKAKREAGMRTPAAKRERTAERLAAREVCFRAKRGIARRGTRGDVV